MTAPTPARFAIGDRVRVVQTEYRDEYAGKCGTILSATQAASGRWHYTMRLDAPVYTRSYCVMVEGELAYESEGAE